MLKLIKQINEANIGDTKAKYAELYKQIREKCPILKDVNDQALKELCTFCWKATGIILQKMTGENFYEKFFKDYKTLGQFIFDYQDDLSIETIIELAEHDPKFQEALEKLYVAYGRMAKKEMGAEKYWDVSTAKGDDLSTRDLVNWIYKELPEIRDPESKVTVRDITVDNFEDKKINSNVIFDQDIFDRALNDLQDIYTGKYLKEDKQEDQIIAFKETEKVIKPENENLNLGLSNALNGLVQNLWVTISDIKSIILSMKDEENSVVEEENIEKILNSVIDDLTIDLGMITRASSLLDLNKAAELMNQGTQKAEEILSEKE